MKKIQKTLIYTGMAAMLAFAACKKEDPKTEEPTPTVADVALTASVTTDYGTTSLPKNDTIIVHFKATGNADNNLVSLKLTHKVTINGASVSNDITIALTGTSVDKYDTLILDEYDATYEISGVLTGAKGNPSSASIPAYYTNTILDMTTPVLLGNQADANPKFWSARLNETKTLADAKGNAALQKDIDFGYCTRSLANGGNKLISPASDDATEIYSTQWSASDEKITNWTVRNTTGFIRANTKISANAFNDLSLDTDSLIEVAKSVGEPSSPTAAVLTGDIFLYRAVRGTLTNQVYYYGLIKVSNPTGDVVGGTANPGNVTLTVRYQKEH